MLKARVGPAVTLLIFTVTVALFLALSHSPRFAAMAAALAQFGKPASQLWRSYCKQLDERPLLSRVATGVVGTIISDAMAQYSAAAYHRARGVKKGAMDKYDFGRTARLVVWSAFAGTPIAYKWFQYLDKTILAHNPTHPKAVLIKTAMDQLLMSPIGTALFLCAIKTMEGKPHDVRETFQQKYAPSLLMSWTVWPAVHYVNFTFVSPQQRILYINLVGIMFGAVMSHFVMGSKHQSKGEEAGDSQKQQ